jgi:hypothetical protein
LNYLIDWLIIIFKYDADLSRAGGMPAQGIHILQPVQVPDKSHSADPG